MSLRRVAVAVFALACVAAQAQPYPDRPLTLVIPFPAGGPTDIVGRALAQKMAALLAQPVVVENRSGAAGQIGAAAVARARADGYTLLLATVSTHGTGPAITAALPYDANKDFTPVSNVASSPMALAVNAGFGARTLAEFVTEVRARPGKLAYANAGAGGIGDLGMAWFLQVAGGSMLSVPYKGSAPALIDVVSGQVPVIFDNFPSTLVQVRGGKLRGLAITGKVRNPAAPELPTFHESGYAEFDVTAWYGLMGPAGLAPEIVQRLHGAVVAALADAATATKLAEAGASPVGNRPEAFAAQIREEIARWSRVVKTAGIRPQ